MTAITITEVGEMPRLVLTRKVGERLRIGDNVFIEVVEVDRGRVRLVVVAPADVEIWRTEIDPRNQSRQSPAPPTADRPPLGRTLLNEIDAD